MKLALIIALTILTPIFTLAGDNARNNPVVNFEAFWKIFNMHYANFEIRQVDWQKQYELFRPKINPGTSQEELLVLLNEMVAPLKDGHVVISPTGDLPASAKYASFYNELPSKELQAQFHNVTLDLLYKNGFNELKKFNSSRYDIGGYCRSTEYGYLLLNGFGGMSLDVFSKQLDDMVTEFADIKGLIIDIRINGGGSPAFLEALTGRLTKVKTLVGYGRTRVSRKHEFSPWKPYYMTPSGNRQLIKPTVVLTSGSTISAGDHCALYLKELPYVKTIGENTNGIFSSMFGKTLPNGWEISLSDGQTVSSRRENYEGTGVPVDIAVVHHRSEMEKGIDPGLIQALGFLQKQSGALAAETICFEQIALNFYADSLMVNKTYGDVAAYSTGLVEEDATLLAPFARKCYSLNVVNQQMTGLQKRVEAEHKADAAFYKQNVQRRFYVALRRPIRSKRTWPFSRRNSRRLTVAHHITINDRNYVRLHLSQGGWKGETVLVVLDNSGNIVEHCFLSYNYLTGQVYQ
jgi:hypothetical protein